MREIKFRAWHKAWERMMTDSELNGYTAPFIKGELWFPTNVVLMQYIGLKDSKGVEIYEGDITTYGTVEWCECLGWDGGGSNHPGFYFKGVGDRGELDYHVGFDNDIEVIGNIYEDKL